MTKAEERLTDAAKEAQLRVLSEFFVHFRDGQLIIERYPPFRDEYV